MARSPVDSVAEAERQARATLRVGSATCQDWTFDARTTSDEVTVEITCSVDLSSGSMVPLPGSITQTASATEVFDQYMERL
jgi:hypothetical protein